MNFKTRSARLAGVIALFLLVSISTGSTSCDGKKSPASANNNAQEMLSAKRIDELASWSRELAHDTGIGIDAVALLFRTGQISLERKDALAALFGKVAQAGASFNSLVSRFSQEERAGTLPANWKELAEREWSSVLDLYRALTSNVAALDEAPRSTLNKSTGRLDEAIGKLKAALGSL